MSTSTAHGSSNGGAPGGALQGPGSLVQMAGRVIGAIAEEAQRRVPTADLDERDPDYIRETLPRPLDAGEPLLPRRRARPPEHPGGGPGAARGQPLGRQPHARHARLHAGVQHLLRRRAALPPARPQPRALDAGPRQAAQVRDRRGDARERPARARRGRRAARLPRRRLRGAPPELGVGEGGLRRPQGLHPARQGEEGAARAGGGHRRPGDRAVPLARRAAREAASGSTACSG